MAPEVTAAWIGAAAVLLSATFSTIFVLWVRRQQERTEDSLRETQKAISHLEQETQLAVAATSRDTELVVTALGHLVGGSQARAAGLATLRTLKSMAGARWPEYRQPVGEILRTQLVFVLTRGRNRWEAHEVANLKIMSAWLGSDSTLGLDADMRLELQRGLTLMTGSIIGPVASETKALSVSSST